MTSWRTPGVTLPGAGGSAPLSGLSHDDKLWSVSAAACSKSESQLTRVGSSTSVRDVFKNPMTHLAPWPPGHWPGDTDLGALCAATEIGPRQKSS